MCRLPSSQILIAAVAGTLIGHFWLSIGADRTPLGDGSVHLITMSFSVPALLLLLTGIIGAAPGTALLRRREA